MPSPMEAIHPDGVLTPTSMGSETGSSSANEPSHTKPEIVTIAAHGDLVLRFEHELKASSTATCAFRVSSPTLKTHSRYFASLLEGRFGESSHIQEKHRHIREQYGSAMEAPSSELPVVNIRDIGCISGVKSIELLLADFLYVLHGTDMQKTPPVMSLANLAIVADRFDALDPMRAYVKRKRMIKTLDGKTTARQDASLYEEKVRQRLFVALMLDYPPWVEKYSARLITKGWVGRESSAQDSALWWDLLSRTEEEVAYRRECVLETIQSLQSHFLELYTSKERQCRLGYDSSAQCDSFQLGEMVKFFKRIGILRLTGTMLDRDDAPVASSDDLLVLLDRLRQVPEYQVDSNHHHCGIRTRITPLLDIIQSALQHVGICAECWSEDRRRCLWVNEKRPLLWKKSAFVLNPRAQSHSSRHEGIKAMLTANVRNWSA